MTDPNPLKQAAEEAKARKLAEVAQQEAKLRERGPFEEFEVVGSPILLNMSGANLEDITSTQNISASSPVRDLWADYLRREVAGGSRVAIVRPREPGTIPQMLKRLEAAGLTPAGLRELLTIDWNPDGMNETLFAFGAEVRVGAAAWAPYRIAKRTTRGSILGHTNRAEGGTILSDRHTFLVRLDDKMLDIVNRASQLTS